MTDADWKARLTPAQYRILREKGTERAFTGAYVHSDAQGMYRCAGCGAELFANSEMYDAGSGWPSFTDTVSPAAVALHDDFSHGMHRIEAACASCGGHLGHVFDDGPVEHTGLRYCINSAALHLDPRVQLGRKSIGEISIWRLNQNPRIPSEGWGFRAPGESFLQVRPYPFLYPALRLRARTASRFVVGAPRRPPLGLSEPLFRVDEPTALRQPEE